MTNSTPYGASPTRARTRRTKAEMEVLQAEIFAIIDEYKPMSVRGLFYQGVSRGLWEKSETSYKNIACRVTAVMRRQGAIPYSWLADSTRWMRAPRTWSSVDEALREAARSYRRALWTRSGHYVEVWLEKEALAGVIVPVTQQWDVPLMVTRGYPSLSFLSSAAEVIKENWRCGDEVHVLYLGDHDPSGDNIAHRVRKDLIEMSGAVIDFTRVAVRLDQIDEYDLPTRPTKQSDTRTKSWAGDGSVEVDAIDPQTLRDLVEAEITALVDPHELEILLGVEREERRQMIAFTAGFGRTS